MGIKRKVLTIIILIAVIWGVYEPRVVLSDEDKIIKEVGSLQGNGVIHIEDIPEFENESNYLGISLPYDDPESHMVIEMIGQYTGPFLEDEKDIPVSNIVSLIVRNDSDNMIKYGEINLNVNDKDIITFKITNLPANESILVMESTGSYKYKKDDTYECLTSTQTNLDSSFLRKKKIEIVKTEDGKITIENKSSQDLDRVYVYYKYLRKEGLYLGGVTYRVEFDNVASKEVVEKEAMHFCKEYSKILIVDY